METLRKENEYMDHIIDKVKDFFNMESDSALIDVEIFLNKIKSQQQREWIILPAISCD